MTAITIKLRDDIAGRIQSDPRGIERVEALISREFANENGNEKWEYEIASDTLPNTLPNTLPMMSEAERREVVAAIDESYEEGPDFSLDEAFSHVEMTIKNRKKVA
jgi:hypothetical protein